MGIFLIVTVAVLCLMLGWFMGWFIGRAHGMVQMADELELQADKNMNPDAND